MTILGKALIFAVVVLLNTTCTTTWAHLIQDPKEEDRVMVGPQDIHETCLYLGNDEKINYAFQSSQSISFNLHYHNQAEQSITVAKGNNLKAMSETFFAPPNAASRFQSYCLLWSNLSDDPVRLDYAYRIDKLSSEDKVGQQINFRLDDTQKSIRVLDQTSGQRLFGLSSDSPIVNFGVSPDHKRLVILSTAPEAPITIYQIGDRQLIRPFDFPMHPRFMAFSQDGQRLALANEHELKLLVFDFSTMSQKIMDLPDVSEALDLDEATGELLVRTPQQILRVDMEAMKVVEEQAKITVMMGTEELLVEPTAFCFAHGVPHPLYAPSSLAMTPEGLSIMVSKFQASQGFVPSPDVTF